MASVSITDDLLTLDMQGLHQLLAFKRRIRVPLAHVRGATADPGIVHEPKGLRAPSWQTRPTTDLSSTSKTPAPRSTRSTARRPTFKTQRRTPILARPSSRSPTGHRHS